jgi:hypothetical protein
MNISAVVFVNSSSFQAHNFSCFLPSCYPRLFWGGQRKRSVNRQINKQSVPWKTAKRHGKSFFFFLFFVGKRKSVFAVTINSTTFRHSNCDPSRLRIKSFHAERVVFKERSRSRKSEQKCDHFSTHLPLSIKRPYSKCSILFLASLTLSHSPPWSSQLLASFELLKYCQTSHN